MTKQPIVLFVILSLITPGWMLCGSDTWAGYTVDRGGKVDTGEGMQRQISVTNDFIPAGCIGLRAYEANARFDNLAVQE